MGSVNEQLAIDYQTLLTENESLATLERAAKLVWGAVGGRIVLTESAFSFQPSTSNAAALAKRIRSSFRLEDVFDVERWRKIVAAHPARSREHRRLRALVVDVSAALTAAPAIGSLADFTLRRYSLLIDSCLLLAHNAYFALLPKLDDPRYAEERVFLLLTFRRFAESLSGPADRFALLALYFDAVGKPRQASESRRASLAATPADAHDFVTVLQSAWTDLVERGLISEALDLLLENYPRVSRRDLDEVGELIRQTFRRAAAANGHSEARHKTARH
ncbi:MAG TPA: hypothetical protein VF278_18355 [Pirellulales bacterium]